MPLQRGPRTSFEPVARCPKPELSPSRKWVAKVESGIDDMYEYASRNTLAADLRCIGNKYDKLVLKMFNQRSHLRGDIMLLKKDAQILRNEMKCLVVKRDDTTAFKKGFGTEDHEKERILKAEMVTKEMGQLELALADLMSKYYYLLQQTKALKEINSLWHIRSVLNSDILQLNSLKSGSSLSADVTPTIKNSIVKKDSKEIKGESGKLIEKVRWLTKLSHEFRNELHELGSAKMALLTGRSCLENQYCNVGNIEPIQESIPRALDVKSLSTDIRNAELRIIDSLHERTEALDKLTDAFKSLMVKAGFSGPDGSDAEETDEAVMDSVESKVSMIQVHDQFIADENQNTLTCNENTFDSNQSITDEPQQKQDSEHELEKSQESDDETNGSQESDNEPEEIQVRFIREDVIQDTDFRCLQTATKLHSGCEQQTNSSDQYSMGQCDSLEGQMDIQEIKSDRTIVESSEYGPVGSTDFNHVEARRSLCGEEFARAKENFTTSMVMWSRPEVCNLAKNESDETLVADGEGNLGDDETEFCKLIEKQFEDVEDNRRKVMRQRRYSLKNKVLIGESSRKLDKETVDRFTKELTTLLNITSEEYNSSEDEEMNSKSLCDVIDCENRQGRFYMAKSFFESEIDKKDKGAKEPSSDKTKIERSQAKALDISNSQRSEAEVKSFSVDMDELNEMQIEHEERIERDKSSIESFNLSRDVSTSSLVKGKTMTHEDRPVFYDPAGAWKISSSNGTRFQRSTSSLIGSSTLERSKMLIENTSVTQLYDRTKQAENLKTEIPGAYKTLPRGFKSKKSQEKEDNALKESGSIAARQKSREQIEKSCNTLPRKMKITASASKQTKPVSILSKVSSESISSTTERKQVTKEREVDCKNRSMTKLITRANSQIISRGLPKEGKSNLTKIDTDKRSGSRLQRPSSRLGNFKEEAKDGKTDLSSRKPVSRGSVYRSESRSDKTRPTSRNELVRRNDVSIYATLPRSNKRSVEQKVDCHSENKTKSVISKDQKNISNRTIQKSEKSFGLNSGDHEVSDESFEMIDSKEIHCQVETGTGQVAENHHDENQNENEAIQGVEGKKRNMLGSKGNRPKSVSNIDSQNQKGVKQGGERKAKKTVSEKAANFMHNAFKRMTPDSKTSVKNNSKNASSPESVVKRRGQNSGNSRSEKRKSFIPVPTLS